MSLSTTVLVVTVVAYFTVATEQFHRGNPPIAAMFLFYGLANIAALFTLK